MDGSNRSTADKKTDLNMESCQFFFILGVAVFLVMVLWSAGVLELWCAGV